MDEIRSISRFGLSAVTVALKMARISIERESGHERLQQAREEPTGMGEPQLGPIATGMSEIYQFEVRSQPGYQFSLMELRTILDWQIAFQLRSVPGVIEVNTFGGELKTYEVQVDPHRLLNYGISLSTVFRGLQENNANAGGGYIVHGAEQRLIRGEGLVGGIADIQDIVLDNRSDGTAIRISDIGEVRFAPMLRQGAVTRDGDREAVTGMVMMLMGANSRQVVADVKERIQTIQATLPAGVYIDPFYDRTELVGKTIHTIAENIGIGVALVVLMLFLLLGDLRAGLIVAAAIPLSAACALISMRLGGVSANLMSLGAVDFGIIVDGAVVMVENAIRSASAHLRTTGESHVPKSVFKQSAREVGTPILFAGLIVIIVFLPILSLQGVEGKMFRPMAFTFMSALSGALILAVTVMPVMASLFLVRRVSTQETRLVRWLKQGYAPCLQFALRRPALMLGSSGVIFAISLAVTSRFGVEFVPKLDEGDLAIQAIRLPSVSLETSVEMTKAMERTLLKFPQVESVVSKTGRPEIANDPMGVHQTDILVRMKAESQWPQPMPKTELIEQMQAALEKAVPSNSFSFTQPIELRVQELVAGVRSDVGLSLYGDDLDLLQSEGDKIARVLGQVPGAADIQVQQVAGLPYLRVIVRRDAISRYGINSSDVLNAVSSIGGVPVGQVFEGQRRFPMQVRLSPQWRQDTDKLSDLRIDDPQGRPIPISQLAEIRLEDGLSEISRHAIRRRLLIQCNVRGAAISAASSRGSAGRGRKRIVPAWLFTGLGGQFQNLQQASQRLMIAVPVALFLISRCSISLSIR